MNRHEIKGRLGKDAETKFLEDGKSVTKFTLATSNDYKNDQGDWVSTDPDWHEVVCWNHLSDKAQNLRKGQLVWVIGKVKRRYYENDKGEKRLYVETVASMVEEIVTRESSGYLPTLDDTKAIRKPTPQEQEQAEEYADIIDTDSEMPF